MTILEVENLSVVYHIDEGERELTAVEDVNFTVEKGDMFGVVGESGSGKSTVGDAIIGLLDANAEVVSGEIRYKGEDLLRKTEDEFRDLRWSEIAYIPQSALSGFNPVYTIGDQIVEAYQAHNTGVRDSEAHARAQNLLERIGIPAGIAKKYPSELSGGERQRAMIAMALICEPELIIADEPTTALDALVQDVVMNEIEIVQDEFDITFVTISNDISFVAETCDSVGLMYAGRMMERGPVDDVFNAPANPYTLGLWNAVPTLQGAKAGNLIGIPGESPQLDDIPQGCRFASRCPWATEECQKSHPQLEKVAGSEDWESACYHLDKIDKIREQSNEQQLWQK